MNGTLLTRPRRPAARSGALVAFPTETVYGLGALATDPVALRQIFATKGRPVDHPVIVHLPDADHLDRWALTDGTPAALLAAKLWPGPLTLGSSAPRRPRRGDGGLFTVGLRCRATRWPGAARGRRGRRGRAVRQPLRAVSPTTAAHVRDEFGDEVHVLDGGPCTVGVESTIDLTGDQPALLRPGGVPAEAIEAIVGPLTDSATRAPGTLPGHYAPHTALVLVDDSEAAEARADALRALGRSVAVLPAGAPADHARRLYAELRRLDTLGVDVLVAIRAADSGLGRAINDRRSGSVAPPRRGFRA